MPAQDVKMDRLQLLKPLDRAWEALKASYAGLSDSELLESCITGNWSVRDIIAHVTWWEEESLKHLPLIFAGGKPPRYSVLVRWHRCLQRPDDRLEGEPVS